MGIYSRLNYRLLLWDYMEGGFWWPVIEELDKFRVLGELKLDKKISLPIEVDLNYIKLLLLIPILWLSLD